MAVAEANRTILGPIVLTPRGAGPASEVAATSDPDAPGRVKFVVARTYHAEVYTMTPADARALAAMLVGAADAAQAKGGTDA
jgi:hypothetical protein